LAARAEPVACPEDWLGRFRAVPREPVAAWAIDWEGAANWEWPATAWAGLLRTPEAAARVAETWGANDPLEFAALGALEEVAARAEAAEGALDACGVARAVLWPVAERAMDCVLAMVMLWLATAWALRLITVELAAGVLEDGKALLAPAALAELGAAEALAAAACAVAGEGALRAALMPEADCAMDCAEAALMVWLVSARAWPVFTLALAAWEAEGGKALLAPAALAELGAAARLAAAD
jgi:hypothetical protein